MRILMIGKGDHSVYTEEILRINYSGAEIHKTLWPVEGTPIDNYQYAIIAIGDNYNRAKIAQELRAHGIPFINAIHPSCRISPTAKWEYWGGIVAMAGCIFNPGAVIGDFTFFATGAQIEHDCKIEDFASVSAGSVLGGHVTVKKYAAITMGCTIFDRVTIGENAVIGSGSLVTKDTPDNVLMYGSPAKVIRYRKPGEKFL